MKSCSELIIFAAEQTVQAPCEEVKVIEVYVLSDEGIQLLHIIVKINDQHIGVKR